VGEGGGGQLGRQHALRLKIRTLFDVWLAAAGVRDVCLADNAAEAATLLDEPIMFLLWSADHLS
jgi:hypothetical protein